MVSDVKTLVRSEEWLRYSSLLSSFPSSFSPSLFEKGQSIWQIHIEKRGPREE